MVQSLSRAALLRLLDRVDDTVDPAAATYFLAASDRQPDVPTDLHDAFARLRPRNGAVVLWGDVIRLAIDPPFPIPSASHVAGYSTTMVRDLLGLPRTIAVILMRLGGYSVGIFRGDRFVETKTGGRFVKNRNRKGGQSQRRFERIREGQIREHQDEVAEVIRTRLLPHATELDAILLGGDRRTVHALLERAPLPAALQEKVSPRFLSVPEPRRDVLEQTPRLIWSSRVLVVRSPSWE